MNQKDMIHQDIIRLSKSIRPIVRINCVDPVYLKTMSADELFDSDYTKFEKYAEPVVFEDLNILADIKVLHEIEEDNSFKPTIADIIRQIPNNLIDNAIAFEIIYSPTLIPCDYNLFIEELRNKYYVSIVRLYSAYDKNDSNSRKVTNPLIDLSLIEKPIGMSDDEFKYLHEHFVMLMNMYD